MAERRAVIRLGTDGKAQVKTDFRELADAGNASFTGIGNAAEASAQRASRAYDRATADIEAAQRRQASAAAKLSAIAPQSSTQALISGAVGTGFGAYEGSAKSSADAIRAVLIEQEKMEAQARALIAVIDPLSAAQGRYNAELTKVRALAAADLLTKEQLAVREKQLQAELDETTNAIRRQGTGLGAHGFALQNLGFQFQDFAVQVVGGQGVLRAFAQQFPQAIGAVSMMGDGLGGVASFLAGPWGIALTVAATVVAGLASSFLDGGDAAKKAEEAAKSFQSAIDGVASVASSSTDAIIANSAAIQDWIKRARALNAENLTAQQQQAGRDAFAAVRGAANPLTGGSILQRVGAGFAAASGASAEDLTDRDLLAAVNSAGNSITKLKANLDGLRASRPDLKGLIDQVDQAAARFDFFGGQADRLNGKLKDGVIQNEAYTSVLVKMRTASTPLEQAQARLAAVELNSAAAHKAGGATLEAYQQQLVTATQAVKSAEAAEKAAREARTASAKATREAAKEAREYLQSIRELEKAVDPAAANARESALLYADIAKAMSKGDIDAQEAARYRQEVRLREYDANAQALDQARKKIANDNGLDTGALVDLTDPGKASAALDLIQKKVAAIRPDFQGLRDDGRQFVDDVLDPNAWRDWGTLGKTIINDIRSEFLKLALFNPLKNMLLGGNAPTFTSLLGLFGGGSAISTALPGVGANGLFAGISLPHFANGTPYFSGGMAWVGENGPEPVFLPGGTRIGSASQGRRMMGANDGALRIALDVSPSDYFDVRVREVATPVAVSAGQQAMLGGAGLARQQAARDQRYVMGRARG